MFKPITKQKQLIEGSSDCNTAIISLWTRKEEVAEKIDKSKYCVIGQLYSAERGMDYLVRNLLANPSITNLIITGKDLSNSGRVVQDFFEKGFERSKTKHGNDCWKVKSEYDGYIDTDIQEEELEMLRNSIYIEKIDDFDKINKFIPKETAIRTAIFKEKQNIEVDNYGGEDTAFLVRKENVVEAWLEIMDLVMKFGRVTPTQFESSQKEIIEIITVIKEENPLEPVIPDFMPFNKEHFNTYCEAFLEGKKLEGVSYTYGERMRKFFGHDQVDSLVEKISSDPNTRQAVISLWDSGSDIKGKESPCLNYLWARARENKIYLTAMLRSNDMFSGFPENAMALRALQEKIRTELTKKIYKGIPGHEFFLGDLVIISNSAHIYEESWESAKKIVNEQKPRFNKGLIFDERGNFYINIDPEKKDIVVDFLTKDGEKIRSFKGKTAFELRDLLLKENLVGTPDHGVYLGIQLMKAEASLNENKKFEQD